MTPNPLPTNAQVSETLHTQIQSQSEGDREREKTKTQTNIDNAKLKTLKAFREEEQIIVPRKKARFIRISSGVEEVNFDIYCF